MFRHRSILMHFDAMQAMETEFKAEVSKLMVRTGVSSED